MKPSLCNFPNDDNVRDIPYSSAQGNPHGLHIAQDHFHQPFSALSYRRARHALETAASRTRSRRSGCENLLWDEVVVRSRVEQRALEAVRDPHNESSNHP